MCPQLVHLYGPFAINTFGAFLALGLALFAWLTLADKRRPQLLDTDSFFALLTLGLLTGLLGGRLLYVIFNLDQLDSLAEIFHFWLGGFSSLGVVIAEIIFVPWYLKRHTIPILPFLDLAATYIPLFQSIARIGCFFAGCCYGAPTTASWGVTFPYPMTEALAGVSLHPAQLYSSAALMLIFAIMYFGVSKYIRTPGIALCAYLCMMSIERIVVDFFRADQEFFGNFTLLSSHQLIALAIALTSIAAMIYLYKNSPKRP